MNAPHHVHWSGPAWLVAAALAAPYPTLGLATGDDRSHSVADFATDSPDGLMRRFESAYEGRRLDDFAALFTDDFRFYFSDPELAAEYPDGWARTDEIASADHLFHGGINRRGEHVPAARKIELGLDPFTVEVDPEKPDSSVWYRRVVVPAVDLRIWFDQPFGIVVERDRHEFWLVRGDAARLSADQDRDADHWYIRRWVEKIPGLAYERSASYRAGAGADPDSPTVAVESDRPIAR